MKVVSKSCLSEIIINYYFHTMLLEAKVSKKELTRLKQDQLTLKRVCKTKETNKSYEVVSLKSENKVILKKKNKKGEKRLRFS